MPRVAEDRQHDAERRRDAERLRALEDRLARTRGVEPMSREGEKYQQANQAWRMVIELVAGLGIGFGIGYGLDQLFGTTPILLVLFILLGFAAGVKTMMRTAAEMTGAPKPAPGQPAEIAPAPPAGTTPGTPAGTTPAEPAGTTPAEPEGTKGTQRGD